MASVRLLYNAGKMSAPLALSRPLVRRVSAIIRSRDLLRNLHRTDTPTQASRLGLLAPTKSADSRKDIAIQDSAKKAAAAGSRRLHPGRVWPCGPAFGG